MKKIALFLLTMILLLTMALPMSVMADESDVSDASDALDVATAPTTATRVMDASKFNVSVGTATAKQGDTVQIPVTIETNPGVWGFTLDVHYDEKVMVLQTVVFADELKKDMTCLDVDNLSATADHNYNIPFGLYAEGTSLTKNVTTTGLLATLTFLVIPGCDLGESEISLTYKPNNVINVDGDNVKSAMYTGLVEVTKGKPAEAGVTYFPSRTRKSTTTEAKSGALGGTSLILIVVGVVVVVGVVLAILVVRKPADSGEKTVKATAAKPDADESKPTPKKTEPDDASSEDDGIDEQA